MCTERVSFWQNGSHMQIWNIIILLFLVNPLSMLKSSMYKCLEKILPLVMEEHWLSNNFFSNFPRQKKVLCFKMHILHFYFVGNSKHFRAWPTRSKSQLECVEMTTKFCESTCTYSFQFSPGILGRLHTALHLVTWILFWRCLLQELHTYKWQNGW